METTQRPPEITVDNVRRLKRVRQLGTATRGHVSGQKLGFDRSGTRLFARQGARLRWWNLHLCASKDGAHLATFGDGHGTLRDAKTLQVLRSLEMQSPEVLFNEDCAFSPDGRFVAATGHARLGDNLGTFWLWNVNTGALLGSFLNPHGLAWSAAFHPSEPLLVVGGNSDEVLRVDLEACRIVEEVQGFCRPCNLSFHPEGTLLAASRDGGGFGVHRFPTGELLFEHADDNELQTSDALFSPDGRTIAWGQGDGTVGLWSVTD